MSIDLYYAPLSAPCRAVMLTAEAIGLPLNLKHLDILSGEHMTPEYEEMNPQRNVPFLVDGDVKLSESRAIISYLADQYGKNARLYPRTPEGRAMVNQLLNFDMATLYKSLKYYYYPAVFFGKDYDPEQYQQVEKAFEILDKILEGHEYVTGRYMTIADLSLTANVSTMEVYNFEVEKYPNVAKWLDRMKASAPGYRKANGEGLEMMRKVFENSQNK